MTSAYSGPFPPVVIPGITKDSIFEGARRHLESPPVTEPRPLPVPHEMVGDIVKAPNHYTWVPGIECKDVSKYFSAMAGSAMKYIWRHGRKLYRGKTAAESAVIDLRKAVECLQIEIERLQNDETGEYRVGSQRP